MSDSKLKILVIASWYPSRVQPHLGTFVERQAVAAAQMNEVAALHVCSDPQITQPIEVVSSDKDQVFTVNVYYKKNGNPVSGYFRIRKAYQMGLEEIMRKMGKPHLVQLNILWPAGFFFWLMNSKLKLPYIITENWTGYLASDDSYSRSGMLRQYFTRIIANQAALITPVSKDLAGAMKKHGLGRKFETAFNVVNTSLFHPAESARSSGPIRFLHVSTTLEAQKNISGMLRAVKELSRERKDFEFRIVSEKDFSAHEKYAQELGLLNTIVFFESAKQEAGVAEAMRNADCFVLFSNYENLPVVILEAMASGLPVIASTAGGTPEHLSPSFGKLVEPRDEKGLHRAMREMMDLLPSYDRSAIRDYAIKHFSREAVGRRFNDIYRQVVK